MFYPLLITVIVVVTTKMAGVDLSHDLDIFICLSIAILLQYIFSVFYFKSFDYLRVFRIWWLTYVIKCLLKMSAIRFCTARPTCCWQDFNRKFTFRAQKFYLSTRGISDMLLLWGTRCSPNDRCRGDTLTQDKSMSNKTETSFFNRGCAVNH